MRSLITIIFLLASASAQMTTVSFAKLQDQNGNYVTGILSVQATDANDRNVSFMVGGGGQAVVKAALGCVTNGVLIGPIDSNGTCTPGTFNVPDPAQTSPAGIFYRFTVDLSDGSGTLRYTKVQWAGATFNFDNWSPSIPTAVPPTGGTITGPVTISGNFTVTGTCTGCGGGGGGGGLSAHVILDSSAHTDTLTGTVLRGDIIIGNSTPKWSRLGKGAANTFLGSNGTDISYSQVNFNQLAGAATDAQVTDALTVKKILGSHVLGDFSPSYQSLASIFGSYVYSIGAAGSGQANIGSAIEILDPDDAVQYPFYGSIHIKTTFGDVYYPTAGVYGETFLDETGTATHSAPFSAGVYGVNFSDSTNFGSTGVGVAGSCQYFTTGTITRCASLYAEPTFLDVGLALTDDVAVYGGARAGTNKYAFLGEQTARSTAGQTDSDWIALRGHGYDTSNHPVDWRQFVDVTANTGASTYRLQSRIGAGSFTDRITVSDAGNLSIGGQYQVSGVQISTANLSDGTNIVTSFVNDTNVTASLAGHVATLGWAGTLAAGRLNANVVQAVTNDTNITGSISAQNITLGWNGTLAAGRLNSNVVQAVTTDTNITGSISAQNITLGWAGTLAKARQHSATVYNDQANSFSSGSKQTVQASATTAGFAFGGTTADPSSPANGDLWYRSDLNTLLARLNGISKTIATTDLTAPQSRNINTTSPITGGGDLSVDRTVGCASCVTASSPGAGIAHFPGSSQAVTSSAVDVSSADITGVLKASAFPAVTGAVTSAGGALATSVGKVDAIQASSFCQDVGSNDTYACNLSPAISSYVTGTLYWFKANTANTGAATINFNSLGAKSIKTFIGAVKADPSDNDIRAGMWVPVIYDGTDMVMVGMLGNAAAGGGGAPTTSQYVMLANDGSTSAERVLTAGDGITITDGGANSTVTIAAGTKPLGVNTTTVTCDAGGACGSTETDLQTLTLATNELATAKSSLEMELFGNVSWNGSPNLTIKAYWNSTEICAMNWTSGSSRTNGSVYVKVVMVPSSTPGAAVASEADCTASMGSAGSSGPVFGDGKTGTVNVATNAATPTIKFTAKWSSATATNSITARITTAKKVVYP